MREQCTDSSHRVRAAPEGAPDSEQCLSGAPRRQSSNGRNRQNPNGWVTWLAHRTVSGGAPDCPVRPSTAEFPNDHFGGWGYKYPNHHTSMYPSFQPSNLIQELWTSFQDTNKEIKSSPKSGITPNKLVTRERHLCSFELLRLDCFLKVA